MEVNNTIAERIKGCEKQHYLDESATTKNMVAE